MRQSGYKSIDRHQTIRPILITGIILVMISCGKAKYPDGLFAELVTNKGKIVLQLEYEKTPMTVANFVGLAEGRIANQAFPQGTPYFDGSVFHRVVPGHVIQAGAPAVEGKSSPGYTIPNEIHPELSHGRAGILGMANGGPHTNGSQFYITLGDSSYLDGDYTVFGEVWTGMEVVAAIAQGDTIQSLRIARVGKGAKSFRTDEDTFQALVAETQAAVKTAEEAKSRWEGMFIKTHFPGAQTSETGWKYVIVAPGTGGPPKKGAVLKVLYTGQNLTGEKFYSSAEDGKPRAQAPAEPFVYRAGESSIIPGIDEALREMKMGEKRTLILPAEHAYGTGGFYAKEIPGQKRFVISPNTTLQYDIEVIEIK